MQDIEELLSKISDLVSIDFSCMHECYDINSFKNHLDESNIDIYEYLFKYYKKQYSIARQKFNDR